MKPVITVDDEARIATIQNGEATFELHGIHPKDSCAGPTCILHSPTRHDLRDRILQWHGDQFFYRVCKHGEWVYDPDQVKFWEEVQDSRRLSPTSACGCGLVVPRSRAICFKCKDYIESMSRHDFVMCGCGETFVDGGSIYYRGGGSIG